MLKRMRNLRVFLVLMAALSPGVVLASGPAFNDTTQRPLAPDANGNVGVGTTTPQGAFVVTNGNVGIGTWAPVQLLDVKGTTRVANFIMSGQSPSNGFVLSATDSLGDTTWIPSTVGGGWTVVGSNTYLTTPSNNVGVGTTTPQGAFVVTNGNVGIGTWVPVNPVTVRGDTPLDVSPLTGTGRIQALYAHNTTGSLYAGVESSAGGAIFTGSSAYASVVGAGGTTNLLQLATNQNVRMTIDTSGNVGIGSTNPTQGKLVIGPTSDASILGTGGWRFYNSANDNYGKISNPDGTTSSTLAFVTNSEVMRLTTGGNVGIGSTLPVRKLQVYAGNSDGIAIGKNITTEEDSADLTFYASGASANQRNWMISNYVDVVGSLSFVRSTAAQGNPSGGAGLTSMILDRSGNVGIGVTNPGALIHVASQTSQNEAYLTYSASDTNPAGLWLNKTRGNIAGPVDVNNGDSIGQIHFQAYSGGLKDTAAILAAVDGTFTSGQTPPSRLQFYTNTANGAQSERVRIDNNGNLGIGITSPTSLVAINAPIGTIGLKSALSLMLHDNNDTDGDLVQIGFGEGNTIAAAVIGTVHVAGAYGKNDIFFATRDVTTDTAPTERMRIQTDGNVGIGTTSPAAKLDINSGTLYVGRTTAGKISVNTDLQSSFGALASSGLDISEATGAQTVGGLSQISLGEGNNVNAHTAIAAILTSATSYGYSDLIFGTRSVTTDTAPTERMRITSAGNVGIGTIGPLAPLHILSSAAASTSGQVGLIVSATNAGGTVGSGPYIRFDNGGGNVEIGRIGSFAESSGNAFMSFYTYNSSLSEKMRISAAGNVGIGSTAPGANLDVNNTIRISGTAQTQMSTQGFSMLTWLTTAAAADAWVGDGDYIKRVTSLRANKFDIQPIAIDDARRTILGLHGVTYRSRVDEDKRLWAGFIADDAEKVNPVLVTYDKYGKLQSFTYDRVSAYLVPVVQELDKQVQELAKENQALKARVEALEKRGGAGQ